MDDAGLDFIPRLDLPDEAVVQGAELTPIFAVKGSGIRAQAVPQVIARRDRLARAGLRASALQAVLAVPPHDSSVVTHVASVTELPQQFAPQRLCSFLR